MLQALPHTTWNTPRSLGIAAILWLCFGTIGLHRAYLNRKLWLAMFLAGSFGWLTLSFGIGLFFIIPVGALWLVDLFRFRGWVADHNAIITRGS